MFRRNARDRQPRIRGGRPAYRFRMSAGARRPAAPPRIPRAERGDLLRPAYRLGFPYAPPAIKYDELAAFRLISILKERELLFPADEFRHVFMVFVKS